MGLIDIWRARRDLARPVERGALLPAGPEDISNATVLWQSYSRTNVEPVIPTMEGMAVGGYAGSSSVFSLIALRMLLFAEAVPRWYDLDKRRMTADTDGLEILMEPWPGADHGEMLARAELDVSLAGNAFLAHPEGLDRLIRLRPDWVTIQRIIRRDGRGRPYTEVDGYWYGSPFNPDDVVFYDVGEVAHYSPYPDPLAEFRGMSWLTPVVREITQDRAMSDYVTKFFENAASPNMVIKYQQNLGEQRLRQVQENLRQRHAGLDNAYQAIVLDSGADVTIAGNSFEQMNFTSLRAATENRLASAAGVPPMIVGFKEGLQASTLANYDSGSRRLADMTMRPLWRIFASVMRKVVVPPRKVGQTRDRIVLRLDAGDISALQEGAQARADTFKTKALTAGELIRAGYEPKTVAEAVEAEMLSLLTHTEKTPTALYDSEGNQTNAKPGTAQPPGAPGPRPGKEGEGAAAPQPRSRTLEEDGEMHPDDVRRLMADQRESMLEAFRAGLEAGRLIAVSDDDAVRHPGHPNQKVHGRKGAGGGEGEGEGGGGGGGTSGTGTKDDPIKTDDPAVAARALYEDKYVEFKQPRMVSTSLSKLKEMIDEAQARGEDKGTLNLCKASLAGTNLFCAENKGIPRTRMPQLSGRPLPGTKADKMPKNAKGEVDLGPAFRDHLASKGIKIVDDTVDASVLKASQSELQASKVLGIAEGMRAGKVPEARIFVTQDDYVVDGHHRWAAAVSNEFVVGKPMTQQVAVIQADILTVLAEANSFSLDMGIPQAGIGVPGRSGLWEYDPDTFSAIQQRVASEFGAAMLDWVHGS